MNRRINLDRVIILLVSVFAIFLMISHVRVTADFNLKITEQNKKIEETEAKTFKLEQDKAFIEERINLLNEAYKDAKK